MKKQILTCILSICIGTVSPASAGQEVSQSRSWIIPWVAGSAIVSGLGYYFYKTHKKNQRTSALPTTTTRNFNGTVSPVTTTIREPEFPAVPRRPMRVRHKKIIVDIPSNFDTISNLSLMMQGFDEDTQRFEKTVFSQDQFTTVLQEYASIAAKQLGSQTDWIHNDILSKEFFDLNACIATTPYAQKLVIPKNSRVVMFGDLHGCAHSLVRNLERLRDKDGVLDDNLKIIAPSTYILFLGDFVDRDTYGVEVLYTLMRLKIANPDHVFLVRGNHEDCVINHNPMVGGFANEIREKFSNNSALHAMVYRMYDLLPAVIYVGFEHEGVRRYFQCCHGGMEMGFNPQELFKANSNDHFQKIDILSLNKKRHSSCEHMDESMKKAALEACNASRYNPDMPLFDVGFLWNDFDADNENDFVVYRKGRGWKYGRLLTQEVIRQASTKNHTIVGVIRAHQSSGTLFTRLCQEQGLAGLWTNEQSIIENNLVYTTFSAPFYPGFNLDSYVLLTIQDDGNWTIVSRAQPIRV